MRTQAQARFTGQGDWKANRLGSATEQLISAIERERAVPVCPICNESHLGCEDWGCWKNAGAAGMVREAIAKERKVNVVNLILSAAILVGIAALVVGVVHVL